MGLSKEAVPALGSKGALGMGESAPAGDSGSQTADGRVDEGNFAQALQALEVLDSVLEDVGPTVTADHAFEVVLQEQEDEGWKDETASEGGYSEPSDGGGEARVADTSVPEDRTAPDAQEATGEKAGQRNDDQSGRPAAAQSGSKVDVRSAESRAWYAAPRAPSPGPDEEEHKGLLPSLGAGLRALPGRLVSEASYAFLLVPYWLAFANHSEDNVESSRWRMWLLLPLYALAVARLVTLAAYWVMLAGVVVERLPPRVTLFVESFRGWPSVCVVWLVIMDVLQAVNVVHWTEWQQMSDQGCVSSHVRPPGRSGRRRAVADSRPGIPTLRRQLAGGPQHLAGRRGGFARSALRLYGRAFHPSRIKALRGSSPGGRPRPTRASRALRQSACRVRAGGQSQACAAPAHPRRPPAEAQGPPEFLRQ